MKSLDNIARKSFATSATSRLTLALIFLGVSSVATFAAPKNPHAGEPIGTVEQLYDGALTPDLVVNTARNIDRIFPTRTIGAGEKPSDLPVAEKLIDPKQVVVKGDPNLDLYDYLAVNSIASMVVLHDGKIVYETYQRGNTVDTRWMSMSVAKSIASTLIGAAIYDGKIKSLDSQVVDYVPALKGTAYDGVTVRDVLQMASGVKWDETYTDPKSDRRALLRAQIAQKPGSLLKVMAALPRSAEPGTVNNYSTGETQIVAEILHGALKGTLSDYLSEKIWRPAGMQSDATWWLDSPDGVEIAGSGLAATARDFARFGLLMMNDGVIDGKRILPEGWVAEATRPTKLKNGKPLDYGYLWWVGTTERAKEDHIFAAHGIFGQSIYVNPAKRVVMVLNSAWSKPSGVKQLKSDLLFDAVTDAVVALDKKS